MNAIENRAGAENCELLPPPPSLQVRCTIGHKLKRQAVVVTPAWLVRRGPRSQPGSTTGSVANYC